MGVRQILFGAFMVFVAVVGLVADGVAATGAVPAVAVAPF